MCITKEIKNSVKMIGDIKHFNFAELTSNDNGKTSMSSVCGGIVTICGCVGFIAGTFTKNVELLNNSIMMTSIGAGLLGLRKIIGGKQVVEQLTTTIAEGDAEQNSDPKTDEQNIGQSGDPKPENIDDNGEKK